MTSDARTLAFAEMRRAMRAADAPPVSDVDALHPRPEALPT